jgi:hypothetical protein
MRRTRTLLYLLVFVLNGCAVFGPSVSGPSEGKESASKAAAAGPSESAVGTSSGEWTVRDLKYPTARVEFFDGDTEDAAECGISFFNAIKDPKKVTAALLVADGELYPLEEIRAALVKSETHELQIRTILSRKSLLTALNAETIYLIAVIDKIEYQFEPGSNFAVYKKRALKKLN